MKFYPLTMKLVMETVCAAFHVQKHAVISKAQNKPEVFMARKVFALLAMRMTRATANQIAAALGGTSHARPAQLVEQVQQDIVNDTELGAVVRSIQHSLEVIARSKLMRWMDDANAYEAAKAVMEDPFRNAPSVSKDDIIAMAARVLDGAEFIEGTAILLQLLNLAAAETDPVERAEIERVAALYRGSLASMLQNLGVEPVQKEAIHELAA